MNTKEILIKAKALIEDQNNWTTEKLAKNASGRREDYASPNACKFCAIGAVLRIAGGTEESTAWDSLDAAAEELYGRQVIAVNDDVGHAAVLKVYDLAISKEKL